MKKGGMKKMSYKTIRQKAHEEAKRATNPICQCGDHCRRNRFSYYINEFGERVPICNNCLRAVEKTLDTFEFLWFIGEVRNMSEVKRRELQAVRIEVAVQICIKFPSLYPKIYGKSRTPITDYESAAADILVGLIKLEPSIKHILDFYYKREGR